MIELIATAESVEQGKTLLDAGIDTLYVGEDEFGLRLPASLSLDEIHTLTDYAHENGKQIYVAVNALMHNDRIEKVMPYLQSLQSIGVDAMTVGDPGVIHLMKKNNIVLPYIYDAQVMVTSANQVNFWAKRGAVGAVLARELTYEELKMIQQQTTVPVEVLVYGATCIHQSKRPLVHNYFGYIQEKAPSMEERQLFLVEPKKEETHYSIYEDINGTHIFATDDVNLMPQLGNLADAGLTQWKLDGIFTRGERFIEIARLFVEAKQAFEAESWSEELAIRLNDRLQSLHPQERALSEGFFLKDPTEIQ
ncbi:peptidase U32 family protein [Sporosarcina sp. 179-K 3D1 HS]|uniref:peptidase U32 family protein n=1 Tax=Sporosarcina sp. 179-K 3D1 HS TaxID=3232169 RepID=UPI0039A00EAE